MVTRTIEPTRRERSGAMVKATAGAIAAAVAGRPPSGATSGEDRANRFLVILLALQRLSYLVPTVLSTTSTHYRSVALNTALVAGTVAWNVVLFARVRRQGWFTARQVWFDVGWTALLILAITLNLPAADEHTSLNWSGRMGQAGAALAGVALERLGVAIAGVGVLLGAHTASTVLQTSSAGELAIELAACLNGLIWFAVILRFALHYLRRQGRRLDELAEARLAADSQRAADQARYTARLAHHRALHDTVLATLVAVARGGLDHRDEQVRQRCARDAAYIRRLLHVQDDNASASDLEAKLRDVVAGAEALGLRVHCDVESVPDDLPAEVVEALGDATREALNNVIRHASTGTAWVTATRSDEMVVVRVVDRGRGFASDDVVPGFGLATSIHDRMRAAGGGSRVTSEPGEGTCVELVWPA